MLLVDNDGKEITRTNYWETELNARSKLFFSLNAGAFRMLVPDAMAAEMKTELPLAREITIIRDGANFEILLDDRSDVPYTILVTSNSFDRLPAATDAGKVFTFSAWVQGRAGEPVKIFDHPCEMSDMKKT